MQFLMPAQGPEEELKNTFASVSFALTELLSRENVQTKAFSEGLPHFSALSLERKTTALASLQNYYELCAEHVKENQSLRDSKKFTWRALGKMALAPVSDLLDSITEGDVVEIYNLDHVQVFRNLEFFDFCSYTIEELYCLEWWRLFHREEKLVKEILRLLDSFHTRKNPQGLWNALPAHVVSESLSTSKYKVEVLLTYLGPLYSNRQVQSVICIEKAAFV